MEMETKKKPELSKNTVSIVTAVITGLFTLLVALVQLAPTLGSLEDLMRVAVLAMMVLIPAIVGVAMFALLVRKFRWAFLALLCGAALAAGVALLYWNVRSRPGLQYVDGAEVSLYGGPGVGDAFESPQSLTAAGDILYLTDAGKIRRLEDGKISTVDLPYLYDGHAAVVRAMGGDLYVLTGLFENEEQTLCYGFLRIRNGETELISRPFEARMGAFSISISDFTFSRGNVLWFLQQYHVPDSSTPTTLLRMLPHDLATDTYGDPVTVMELPYAAPEMENACLVFDEEDNLYISAPEKGVLLRIGRDEQKSWTVFAGQEDVHAFNDRGDAALFHPTALAVSGDFLYVLDHGVIRRVGLKGDQAGKLETLAGMPPDQAEHESQIEVDADGAAPGKEFAFYADDRGSLTVDSRGRLVVSSPADGFLFRVTASK